MKHLLIAIVGFTGCVDALPTAPSTNGSYVVNWTGTADGCNPDRPIPTLKEEHLTHTHQDGNTLTLEYTRPDDLVYAIFHRHNNTWRLCAWDTTDN